MFGCFQFWIWTVVWSLFSGAWELGLARNAFVLDLSEAAGPHLRSFMHCWLGHSLEKTPHSNANRWKQNPKKSIKAKTQRGRKEEKEPDLTIFIRIQAFQFLSRVKLTVKQIYSWWLAGQMTTAIDWTFDQFHRASKTSRLRLIGTDWRYGLLPIEVWAGTRL